MTKQRSKLDRLLKDIRACTHCAAHLPLAPRPVLEVRASARLLIVSHAPGIRVHETGLSWNDPSGKRLRQWLGLTPEQFYDADKIALIGMGFCYPGSGKSGDLPPRPECAALWHDKINAHLNCVELTLLIGSYAHHWYLKNKRKATLTETVKSWHDYIPLGFVPLVHPSGRNMGWLKRNPWFERELVPALRQMCKNALA